MKKTQKQQQQQHGSSAQDDEEIIKAVAQAWYAKSSSSRSLASEFDTHRRNFKSKPSRFKLEAMKKAASLSSSDENGGSSTSSSWDFGESLWDSYEIVAISKRLERGLVLDHFLSSEDEAAGQRILKKRKESNNSLRNILNKMSSRRFDEPNFAPSDWY